MYSPVILFSHREPEVTAIFLSVKTSNNHNLLLTKNHLIHASITVSGDNFEAKMKTKAIFAGDLHRGDSIISLPSSAGNVTTVHDVVVDLHSVERQGVYAPVTHIGTIVVDDIVASCYCEIINHDHVHATFSLFRLVYATMSHITGNKVVIASSKNFPHGNYAPELSFGVRNSNATFFTSSTLAYTQTVFDICYWIVTRVCQPTSFVGAYVYLLL